MTNCTSVRVKKLSFSVQRPFTGLVIMAIAIMSLASNPVWSQDLLRHNPGDRGERIVPGPPEFSNIEQLQINRSFRGGSTLVLNRAVGFNPNDWRNYRLTGVTVYAQSQSNSRLNQTDIAVEVNGQQVGYPQTPGHRSRSPLYFDLHRSIEMNRNTEISLSFSGRQSVQVESIELSFESMHRTPPRGPGHGPGPGGPEFETLRQNVYHFISHNRALAVDSLFQLQRQYHGDDLMNVAVTIENAGSRFSRTSQIQAELLINGRRVGNTQRVNIAANSSERLLFRLPPSSNRTIGTDVQMVDVQLSSSGADAYVSEVEALVSLQNHRNPRNPRDPRNPRFPRYQNHEFDFTFRNVGSFEKKLTDIVRIIDFRIQAQTVHSLTLYVQGKGRSSIQVCAKNRFGQIVDCGQRRQLSNTHQAYFFDFHDFRNAPEIQELFIIGDGALEMSYAQIQSF